MEKGKKMKLIIGLAVLLIVIILIIMYRVWIWDIFSVVFAILKNGF